MPRKLLIAHAICGTINFHQSPFEFWRHSRTSRHHSLESNPFLRVTLLILTRDVMKRTAIAMIAFGLLLFLFACSSGEQKKSAGQPASEPAAPAAPKTEAITGRYAFQNMYRAGRTWATDEQGFRLESQTTADATGADGKSAVWRGRFGSVSKGAAKPVMWSGSIDPDAPSRGLNTGGEDSFNA